jgi:hypothetical protein
MDVMSGKIVSIDKQIDKVHHQKALGNQDKLKSIIKTIILCGRQYLPLRAHRDYGTFNLKATKVILERCLEHESIQGTQI